MSESELKKEAIGGVKMEPEFIISEEERKLIEAARALKLTPKVEKPEDLEEFMKSYVLGTKEKTKSTMTLPKLATPPIASVKESSAKTASSASVAAPTLTTARVTHLKIPQFYGESGKGEVNYQTWAFEIKCLIGKHSEDEIMLAIRRSVKGEAADIVRRLGVDTTVREVIKKFEATYGDIETSTSILRKFYACQQQKGESVIKYAARVEEIYVEAIELKAIASGSTEILKNTFYDGLIQPIKSQANYKFNTVRDYDAFKVEVRKIEKEMESSDDIKVKTKCQAINKTETKPEKSELAEMKELLIKLNSRIETLEKGKGKVEASGYQESYRGYGRGHEQNFRDRGGNNRGNRGRGDYKPTRPTGSSTMKPIGNTHSGERDSYQYTRTCYNCGKQGHIARYCQGN